VVWCIGLGHEFDRWIELPVLDDEGMPIHDRGVVAGEPGLYILGLPYQSRPDSALVGGVGSDAGEIVARLAGRLGANGLRGDPEG
jgi:putative flavoprotein involved in K+ transport